MAITLISGGTTLTLDSEGRILNFTTTHSSSVAIPEWVNQSPTIDTSIWSRRKEILTYDVRLSDAALVKLRTLQATHALIDFVDAVYGKTGHVWIESWEATWDWEATLPWTVTITLIHVP